jgi:hypothetical protein
MNGNEKPEITPDNKDEQLNLKPGEYAYMDKYGVLHTAGNLEELQNQMQAMREDN